MSVSATLLVYAVRLICHADIFRNTILHDPFLNTSDATRVPLLPYPVYDLGSTDVRCNVPSLNAQAKLTLPIEAGSEISFAMLGYGVMYHPGPGAMYLGKVPQGETAATWDGSGKQWFKVGSNPIFPEPLQLPPVIPTLIPFQIKHWGGTGDRNPKSLDKMWTFETYYESTLNVTIPTEVPSGEVSLASHQGAGDETITPEQARSTSV